ncbi:Calx-beta domain-containing protein [Candidatus Palauibacter sp.]|uniref:Calx-beta domain-containing protein n=1 Tax=Candidatus Palauibacter sp. TaxID=3101350 RepID=UPI003B016B9F
MKRITRRGAQLSLLTPALLALLPVPLGLFVAAPAAAQDRVVPGVPRDVRVVTSATALMLTWQAPASWGSFPASGYQIDWAEGASVPAHSSSAWQRATDLGTDATKFILTDRTYGTTYHLRLRAFSTNPGNSSDLLPGEWVVKSGTPSHTHGPPPGKPTLTLVTTGPNAPTATTLSFTIPCVSPGWATVTDYQLWTDKTVGSVELFHPPSPCSTITATLTGLESATRYRVRGRARNQYGRTSEPSDWVQGTTVAQQQFQGGGSSDPTSQDTLTASFERVPAEHGGRGTFAFLVRLSETVGNFSKSPRASSFEVKRGSVRTVKQVEGGLWRVRVKPGSWRDVEVTLAGGRDCDAAGAVCTPDGRPLGNTSSATVPGPARLKAAGGEAREGKPVDFAVTLNREASGTVTVDYTTEDETASAGSDYTAVSGTLTFAPGETEKAVRVETLADTASEGKEVFRLKLKNASGARIADGKAAGWIRNVAASQTAGDRVPGKVVGAEEARALAIAGELSTEDAADALLARSGLEEKRLEALDRLGNANGRYDVGDLLAWIERCRNGEARCDGSPRTAPSAVALPAAIAAGAMPRRPRRRAPRGRVRRRRRTGMLTVLLAATLWSCDAAVGPTAAIAPEPGYLAVEWTATPGGPVAAGALVEIDGPGIGDVRAPGGLELYGTEGTNGPRRFVLGGEMRNGPVLEFEVPDRRQAGLYTVRVVEVAGADHRLLDADRYRAGIASN